LLLKAVLMPTTTKAFCGALDETPAPAPATPLRARSTASSISSEDTALSSDLLGMMHARSHQITVARTRCVRFTWTTDYGMINWMHWFEEENLLT
jgi:hypothetical protein